MLFVSTGRDGRGRGRERTVATSLPTRRVAAGGPVERFGLPCSLGFVLCFPFPGDRRNARPGRPVLFRAVRPECPVEAPRSVRGQPTFPGSPGSPGASVRECSGLPPLPRL